MLLNSRVSFGYLLFILDSAGGDVKMCESESKDGLDDLDDVPRKPFIRVSSMLNY